MTQKRTFSSFRHHIEATHGLSAGSAVRYVHGAKELLRYCAEHGLDLERGAVPSSLLVNLAEHHDEPRCLRGAALYCEFLRQQGVPLPLFDAALRVEDAERLLSAAATLREPYATLLHMLPMSGLRADTLRKLNVEDVIEDGDTLGLRHGQGDVQLLSRRAAEHLRRYLHQWRPHFELDSTLLFPGTKGGPISASTISRRLRECQRAAGLPEFRITALSDLHAHFAEPNGDTAASLDGLPPSDGLPPANGLPPADIFDEPDDTPEPPPDFDDAPTTASREETNQAVSDPNNRRNGRKPRGTNRTQTETNRLRDIVPTRGQVHIRHRRDDGELEYCGAYRYENIACDGSIEPFIFSTLAPRWGGGKYFIYDSARPSAEAVGSVYIAEPAKHGPEAPAPLGGYGSSGSSLDELRQTLQVLHEMQAPRGDATAHHQYEHGVRVGRLEALLERTLQQQRDPYGGVPAFGPGLGDATHGPPWTPSPLASMPLPGGPPLPPSAPDVAQQMLDMLMQSQKLMNERAEQERRRADEERRYYRDRLERELTQRSSIDANPFAGATEMVKHFQSFAEAAKDLSPNASNDNNKPWLEKLTNTLIERGVDKGLDSVLDAFSTGNVAFGDVARSKAERDQAASPRSPAPAAGAPRSSTPPEPSRPNEARRSSPSRSQSRAEPAQKETARRRPPERVPEYFIAPARKLDQLAQNGTNEQLGEQLTAAIGALAMDKQWAPFVQPIGVMIMTNQRDQAVRQTATILSALVHGQHLRRATAERVLNVMGKHWDELRDKAIASIQQRNANG